MRKDLHKKMWGLVEQFRAEHSSRGVADAAVKYVVGSETLAIAAAMFSPLTDERGFLNAAIEVFGSIDEGGGGNGRDA